jgi:hypothetical protein
MYKRRNNTQNSTKTQKTENKYTKQENKPKKDIKKT